MCGIGGIIPLAQGAPLPTGSLRRMAAAMIHRGPDDEGLLELAEVGLACRRLSIVDLPHGRQPMCNEDRTIWVVFNGELFDFRETRRELVSRGHQLRTHCDTEIVAHLYEEYSEDFLKHLRGQFALALWDQRRRMLLLARDRVGICPLFWTRQCTPAGEYLLFASEVKALLASGMVQPCADLRGLNHIFTFLALPGPLTCFKGVQSVLPGRYLKVHAGKSTLDECTYWELDFPDRGDEDHSSGGEQLTEELDALMLKATERRLRADVPIASYLSGGVDSSLALAVATAVRGSPVPSFTIAIKERGLDESANALAVAERLKSPAVVVDCNVSNVLDAYPELIRAAELPVVDTSCAALLMLARKLHTQGYKVALTGEGADEWFAGYPWFKVHRWLGILDPVSGRRFSGEAQRMFWRIHGLPCLPRRLARRYQDALEGDNAWLEFYGLVGVGRLLFFSPDLRELAQREVPFDDLQLNRQRMRRWHPFNRSMYLGGRIMLPGHLLAAKGDRVAMNSSVETRYPYLDEDVVNFTARLDPRWKMRGLRDKYLLRRLAQRRLPADVAWRRKAMFLAPFDGFDRENTRRADWVDHLLSTEMLSRSGYFNAAAVTHWRKARRRYRQGSYARMTVDIGLAGVLATQLWHQTYIDGAMADLPCLANRRTRIGRGEGPSAP